VAASVLLYYISKKRNNNERIFGTLLGLLSYRRSDFWRRFIHVAYAEIRISRKEKMD
jgi:hypothetical protein